MGVMEKVKSLFSDGSRPFCSAVILAAGNSVRMGEDKIEMASGSVPVFIRTLKVFEAVEAVDEIVLVTREDRMEALAQEVKDYGLTKVRSVIAGGKTRAESSLAGVTAVSPEAKIIAVHDCARPFVSERIITESIEAADRYYAAAPAVPCTDTLKVIDGEFMHGTMDRTKLCRIQTPQVFHADIIKGALSYVVKNQLPVTDDTSAVEYLGYKTRIIEGDSDNIKLTTPEDLIFAKAILRKRGEAE